MPPHSIHWPRFNMLSVITLLPLEALPGPLPFGTWNWSFQDSLLVPARKYPWTYSILDNHCKKKSLLCLKKSSHRQTPLAQLKRTRIFQLSPFCFCLFSCFHGFYQVVVSAINGEGGPIYWTSSALTNAMFGANTKEIKFTSPTKARGAKTC